MKLHNFLMVAKYADGDQQAQRSVLREDANEEENELGDVECCTEISSGPITAPFPFPCLFIEEGDK